MKLIVIHGEVDSTETKAMETINLPEDWEKWRAMMETLKKEIECLKPHEFVQRSFVRVS